MSKPLLLWVFMLFYILTQGGTAIADTSKPQKETKQLYGMIMESSKSGIERASTGLHAVQDTSISRLAKGGYTGAAGANAMKHPPSSRGRSSAGYSIKPPSLFIATLIFGLLLVTGLF